jgi:hypothetical protein
MSFWANIDISSLFMSREFCSIVRKIYIYTKEEVQKMNSKSSAPRKEEPLTVGEGCAATNE